MTKNDKKHIQSARNTGDTLMLVKAICTVHRSGSARTQAECERMIDEAWLNSWVVVINGCMVPVNQYA